jgi:hypothetical protein
MNARVLNISPNQLIRDLNSMHRDSVVRTAAAGRLPNVYTVLGEYNSFAKKQSITYALSVGLDN